MLTTLFYALLVLVVKTILTEAVKPIGKLIYQLYLKEFVKEGIKKVTALLTEVRSNLKK